MFITDAVAAYALYQAVGVQYYAHVLLFLSVSFAVLLLPKPGMQIHIVDFVETFLIQLARLPHLLRYGIEFPGIVVADKLFDVIEFLVALYARKDSKQVKLCRIEYRGLYVLHIVVVLLFLVQRYE